MPLDATALRDGLEALFASPPDTIDGCAQAWADAFEAYASGIVPPSTTVSAAAAGLKAALSAAFATPAAAPGFEAGLAAFAGQVGAGMAGFTPVPPPAPAGVAAGLLPPFPATHGAAADKWSGIFDAWMKTGSSTLIAPPNTVIPWS